MRHPDFVRAVMDDLSRMIVRDGEGAKHVVDIVVEGAVDGASAVRIARGIAGSVLFRCAVAGADPNWGSILCAIGNSGVDFDVAALAFDMGEVALVRDGVVVSEKAARAARKVMRREAYCMRVRLGRGKGSAVVVTSDLTEAYVRFNSAYSS